MPKPSPDRKSVKTVVDYRKKGLSFREIAKIMKKHHKTVWRWWQYHTTEKVICQ